MSMPNAGNHVRTLWIGGSRPQSASYNTAWTPFMIVVRPPTSVRYHLCNHDAADQLLAEVRCEFGLISFIFMH